LGAPRPVGHRPKLTIYWTGLRSCMEYLVAIQLLCGSFAAYVASRKNRNRFLWFLLGLAVPVGGVLMALIVGKGQRTPGKGVESPDVAEAEPRRPPKRCCGSYIPDCRGCPYFTRPLFDPSYGGRRKGYCELFEKELIEEAGARQAKIAAERNERALFH